MNSHMKTPLPIHTKSHLSGPLKNKENKRKNFPRVVLIRVVQLSVASGSGNNYSQ